MKTIKFRHGKAALASAFAVGLIVASTPLAQSEEETTTEQSAVETTTEQSAVDISEVETSTEQSTAARSAVATPSELVQSSPVTVVETAQDGKTSKQTSEAAPSKAAASEASGAPATATEPAPSATAKPGTASADATAQERSAAVGPQADFKLETVQVKDGVATVKVSGTITDDTGLNKPMESLMLHKRGNKAQVSEVVSATYGGEEAFGDVFDFQPKELKDTFGLSDEDAQFPQILRISLEPTQDGDAKESLVGKKFSATYKVSAEDKDTQWALLATDAGFLPEYDLSAQVVRAGASPLAAYPPLEGYKDLSKPSDFDALIVNDLETAREVFNQRETHGGIESQTGMDHNSPALSPLPVGEKIPGYEVPAGFPGQNWGDANRPMYVGETIYNPIWCFDRYDQEFYYRKYLAADGRNNSSNGMCVRNKDGEQGRFFSREHVSKLEENGRNRTVRSESFTIGGNNGGAWYGAQFGGLGLGEAAMTTPIKPQEVDNASKAIRIQVDGVLDTEGWKFNRITNFYKGYLLTSPGNKFGVLVGNTGAQGVLQFAFLNRDGINHYKNSVYKPDSPSYRAGLRVPPNTPIKITYPTKEKGNVQKNVFANMTRSGIFRPFYGDSKPHPGLTVTKSVTSKEPITEDFVDYEITVDNSGDGTEGDPIRRSFELFDFPQYAAAASVSKVEWIEGNQKHDLGTPQAGRYQVKRETDQTGKFTIDPNSNKVFKIRVHFNRTQTPGNEVCNQQPEHGAYNEAIVEVAGAEPKLANDCVNLTPPESPRVKKTVFYKNYEDTRIQNPGSYRVGYTITISNKPEGGNNQPGRYIKRELVVKDFLGLPEDDVTITEITGGDRYGSKDKLTRDSDGSVTLTYGTKPGKVILNPGEEIEYQMFVNFTKPAVSAPEENLACGQPFSKGHGAYNKVVIEKEGAGTENALTSEICANIPVTPKPTITKEVEENSGTEVTETPEGKLSVQYKVHVENPAAGGNLTDLVIKDRPQFAEDAKNVQYFVKEGENSSYPTTASSLDNGQLIFATVSLTPGQSKTYFVKAVFDKPAYAEQVRATLTCDPQQGAGHGLFNEASLSLGEKELAKDSDCANIPEPEKPVTGLILQKEDTDNNPIPLDKDWQFEIYKADDQWNPQGKAIEFVTEDRAKNQRSTAADALTVGKYVLVETKAPQGYQLLAQPVRLEVYLDGAEIKVKQPDGVNNAAAQVENPNIVKVADVTTGDMPKSGGMGVFWMLLVGLVLLGAAWWFNRRRR